MVESPPFNQTLQQWLSHCCPVQSALALTRTECCLSFGERTPIHSKYILLATTLFSPACAKNIDATTDRSSAAAGSDTADTSVGGSDTSAGGSDTSAGGSDTSAGGADTADISAGGADTADTDGSDTADTGGSDTAEHTPILAEFNICGETVPAYHHIDGIPAYNQCDESREASIWSNDGLNTSTESLGDGWVRTQWGVLEGGTGGYQCTEYVRRYLHFTRGVTETPLGHAKTWCDDVTSQLEVADSPAHGDIVVFHPGGCGASTTYGHVAVIDVVDRVASTFETVEQNGAGRGHCGFSDANCFLRPVE